MLLEWCAFILNMHETHPGNVGNGTHRKQQMSQLASVPSLAGLDSLDAAQRLQLIKSKICCKIPLPVRRPSPSLSLVA